MAQRYTGEGGGTVQQMWSVCLDKVGTPYADRERKRNEQKCESLTKYIFKARS